MLVDVVTMDSEDILQLVRGANKIYLPLKKEFKTTNYF